MSPLDYPFFFGDFLSRLYTLSVQFLNRSAVVKELVEKHYLLQILGCCLVTTLEPACDSSEGTCGASDFLQQSR